MSRKKFVIAAIVAVTGAALVLGGTGTTPADARSKGKGAGGVDANQCFACHAEVKELHTDSIHASLSCDTCHGEMDAHLKNSRNRPTTSLELATCGSCHPDQFDSYFQVNWDATPRNEKGLPTGRSPMQDKLLDPHGFTKEHNEPRAHAFMLIDQIAVDRFAGGRYQFKDLFATARTGKLWDVLEDTGKILPEHAQAGNPVCLQCKTSDFILDWAYMGDPGKGAKWDRTSDVHEFVKAASNPMGCIQCHDPHSAKPRVIRDALIDAVQRDGARPYAEDKGEGMLEVVSFRDDFRKIGILPQGGSNLMCAQCHVEYMCNPGFEPVSGDRIPMTDRRSNHFPWKTATDLLAHFDEVQFADFRHAVTGAPLVKLQHPEMETYWGSVHELAGVQCHDCHMPQITNEAGQKFTSHQVVRPLHTIEASCLGCHPDSTVEELTYIVEGVRNYTKGKMRKAEAAIGELIDTFADAKKAGVSEDVLNQARRQHATAHVLWEWWTAENSDGWHNPELAKETLIDSIVQAKKGTELLKQAMAQKAAAK
jgi:nitrite reductase (cytochrome c-552)